jgi:hypothetical protein
MAMAVPFGVRAAESLRSPMLAHSSQDVHRALQQGAAGVQARRSLKLHA